MADTWPFSEDSEFRDLADAYNFAASGKLSTSYAYLWNNFVLWCRDLNETALPADPRLVATYLWDRSDRGAKHSTLRVIAAAIARRHLDESLDNPCVDDMVRQALEYSLKKEEPGPARVLPLDMECYLAIRKRAHAPRLARGGRRERSHTARMRGSFDVAMIGLMRDARLKVREASELSWTDLTEGDDGLWRISVRNLYRPDERETRVVSMVTVGLLDEMRKYNEGGELILGISPNQIGVRIRDAAMQAGLGPGYSGESPRLGMLRDLETLGVELLGTYAAR